MKAVRATLVGGLGNQMFIAAAALELGQRLHARVEFDVSELRSDPLRRAFGLHEFPHLADCAVVPPMRLGLPGPIRRRSDSLRPDVFVEAGFRYDPRFARISKPIRIRGYFQSPTYFPSIDVRLLFGRGQVNPRLAAIRAAVGDRWVGVHVRRGDYLRMSTTAVHGLCSDGYFLNGLEVLKRASGEALPIVLFTDQPAAVSERILARAALVMGADPNSHEVFDLLAMSAAEGLVISNSSFSWWAAFLADRSDRPVVAPRPWLKAGDIAASDLLLPNWLTLGAAG